MKNLINSFIACLGTVCAYLIGGFDNLLWGLMAFMILDYITGIMVGAETKTLSSQIGFKGLMKKSTIILILIMSVYLDRLVSQGQWIFRSVVCLYYISDEGLSIIENSIKLGVQVPERLKDLLQQIHDSNDKGVSK